MLSLTAALAATSTIILAQRPTFRAAVDLIAVDVQVVTREGHPVADLDSKAFSVTIDGRDRRVVSVDHVQHSPATVSSPPTMATGPSARNEWPASGPVARTFLLAFDAGSFSVAESRRAAQSARAFVDRLEPNDLAGIYAYPFGPRVAPTSDRASVRSALATVTGGAQPMSSQFHLTPAEVIDINAELTGMPVAPIFGQLGGRSNSLASTLSGSQADTLRRVLLRECGSENDLQCAQNIEREVANLAFFYEGEIAREIGDLGSVIRGLSELPGRKTVVVISAGMPAADRPGARPSVGDLARVLGEEAARANASIYALFFDLTTYQMFSAENARSNRMPVSQARESSVLSRFLDQFASTSGGTMIRVVTGSGEGAFGQVLRETSAYYLLGVAPAEADRDGRLHRLKVKVDAQGSTVRSRTWVQIPKRLPAKSGF